ncbi:MAG: DUF4381 family protein, partial [Chthoniobacterales bacterium]
MPVQSSAPAPTPAPIHDIVGPVELFASPFWWIVIGAAACALLAFFVWLLLRYVRRPRVLSTREQALVDLSLISSSGLEPYQFAVKLSDLLRKYLDKAYKIRATTTTSMEFLGLIKNNPLFSDDEKKSLTHFLKSSDLLKYARLEANEEEIEKLRTSAENLIRGKYSV